MTALGPRAHRGVGTVAGQRADAEIERRDARRRQGNETEAVEAPDRHDLDGLLNWPAWRMEVERLAERCQSNFVLVRVG